MRSAILSPEKKTTEFCIGYLSFLFVYLQFLPLYFLRDGECRKKWRIPPNKTSETSRVRVRETERERRMMTAPLDEFLFAPHLNRRVLECTRDQPRGEESERERERQIECR